MYTSPLLENVFGTTGCILWTIQILPQIHKSHKTKDTTGLSGSLMLIWSIAAFFFGTYAIVQGLSIPLIIQPQSFGFLSAISWAQCQHYSRRMSVKWCLFYLAVYFALFGGLEAGLTIVIRPQLEKGKHAPVDAFGYISAILLAGAMIPQYYEIWQLKEVIGISMVFLGIDILGGVFCVLSLVFKDHFDGLATASYACVIILDSGVILCALILNPRARRRRAATMVSESILEVGFGADCETLKGKKEVNLFEGLDLWIAQREKQWEMDIKVDVKEV